MNGQTRRSFYLNNSLWVFFCLCLAPVCNLVGDEYQSIEVTGNESSVLGSVAAIRQLQSHYAGRHRGKFAPTFDELIKVENLDDKFAGRFPVVDGYVFEMKVTDATAEKAAVYVITADPVVSKGFGKTGKRHFYFDSSLGSLKTTDENRPATAADPTF